ncbi:MAG: 4Fe-4S dicluster domain-containing protein [Bacteroidales bacterium]|nr:4Fe-4S dicluster domain-containing protein [Bacteroidales bacterium]
MLKKLRVVLALVFWVGITLLLLDFSGALHHWLGWMAKLQFLPAVLALNVGVIVFLVLLTLIFGRVYCSVLCPLGVFQDAVSHLGTRKSKAPYKYRKELKWLRYGVWVLFVIALILGVQVFVAILAPYSAYGRMVQNLLQPLYLWGNNLFATLAERAGSYAFYPREVWMRSLPTFIIAAVTLVVIVVLSFKGGRTYCNSICPVGTTLSFLSRFAAFRPVIDTEKCKKCKSCEIHCKAQCISIGKEEQKIDYSRCVDCFNCLDTCKFGGLKYRYVWGKSKKSAPKEDDKGRRAFMTGTAIAVGSAALKGIEARAQEADKKVDGGFADVLPKQAPKRETPITPPGSFGARNFYRRCTACQLCVAECPNNVLRPSGRLEHLMQPEMSFEKGYCRPECTRCGELCPAGAILPISKEVKTNFHLGTAGVDVTLCLEATGKSSCGKCAQACPTGAIMMVADGEHRRPVVAEEVCIGCGKCEYLCPVRPISAITVNGKEVHV